MDDRKRLGIFIIGSALVIVVIIAIYMYNFNQKQKAANQAATSTQEEVDADKLFKEALDSKTQVEYTFDPAAEKNRTLNSEDLRKMALSFAERFGSYSNQSNYGNVEDLKILMTPKMQDWADSYVADLKSQHKDNSTYYGITSIAISGEVKKFDDQAGVAEIMVSTQRREVVGSGEPKVFSQNVLIAFEKINNEWKAGSATWQK